jgi:hypothetical protein
MVQEGLMSDKSLSKSGLKQKALHELREFVTLSIYLAVFFCALATYRMLLLREFNVDTLTYAFALINALVVAKVIMIGEYVKVGRRHESKPILVSAVWKAFVFGLLVLAFHVVEEVIKHLVHGEGFSASFSEVRMDDLLGRSLVVFCTFITLFGFREFRRVLGEEKFHAMVFGRGTTGPLDLPSQP